MPLDQLEEDVRDYLRFLALVQAHPHVSLAPTKRVDRIWHLHMLHPRAYHADCLRLFGDVLDHDGGFGSTADEEPELARLFDETAALWRATYGLDYVGAPVACKRNCVSRCRRACASLEISGAGRIACCGS